MRCYLPSDLLACGEVQIKGAEAHYLRDVRRIEAGDSVEIFDGQGRTASGRCLEVFRSAVRLQVNVPVTHPRPSPTLHLIQAIAKNKSMDWLVQKATELGVDEIHPVQTHHAVVHLDGRNTNKKRDRWNDIAINATRQCERPWVPVVHPITRLDACLPRFHEELLLTGDLAPNASPLGHVLQSLPLAKLPDMALAIGPEGDWTDEERKALESAGSTPVNLGTTTLRTETAALYGLSVFRFLYRESSREKGIES